MKTLPLRCPLPLATLFALSLQLAPDLQAEAGTIPAALANVVAPGISRPAPVDLDFPGGTVAELVTALSAAAHTPYNLIGEKAYHEIQLPPMKLRGVDTSSLAYALGNLLRAQGVSLLPSTGNIFVLSKVTPLGGAQAPNFQTFQIAPYLATLSIDAITRAIETAWAGYPGSKEKPLTLKFHEETKLLFVYGPPDALALAGTVIQQLNPAVPVRSRLDSTISGVVSNPNPAAEKARLDQVEEEIKRRKAAREAGAAQTVKP